MLTGATKRIAYAIFAFAIIATPVYATTYHIQTSKDQITPGFDNMGYWSPTLAVGNGYQEYMAGRAGLEGNDRVRNYFTFSLASIDFSTEQLVAAYLEIRRYGFPLNRNDALETVEFFDVTTDYLTLNTQEGISQSIYQDLGTGNRYGLVEIPNTGDGRDVVTISLNGKALADITAAAGSYFSVGGSCTTCNRDQVVFNNSGSDGLQRLTLITAPIPEPNEWTMLVAGLLVIGFIARRRQTAASLSA
jgi:hypothetical protein